MGMEKRTFENGPDFKMAKDRIKTALEANAAALEQLAGTHSGEMNRLALQIVENFHGERRIFLVGNGPQAGVAGMIATAFQHRLDFARPPLPAVALTNDILLSGSLGREGNARQFFSRQLRSVASRGDTVLVFSDGQRDEAIVEALETSRQIGCTTVVLGTSDPDLLGSPPDYRFTLVSESAPRTVEAQLFFGHVLCELVEKELFGV